MCFGYTVFANLATATLGSPLPKSLPEPILSVVAGVCACALTLDAAPCSRLPLLG